MLDIKSHLCENPNWIITVLKADVKWFFAKTRKIFAKLQIHLRVGYGKVTGTTGKPLFIGEVPCPDVKTAVVRRFTNISKRGFYEYWRKNKGHSPAAKTVG